MMVYLFASNSDQRISAFTLDKDGLNLPEVYAPWQPVNTGHALSVGSPGDRIAAAVKADRFLLLTADGNRQDGAGRPAGRPRAAPYHTQ